MNSRRNLVVGQSGGPTCVINSSLDILEAFPPGELPPEEQVSMRPGEELEAVTKKPFEEGWRHLYTLAWPF